MKTGFVIPEWCSKFDKLHDMQMDHFWRPPSNDKFDKDRKDWQKLYSRVQKRIKSVVHVLTKVESTVMDNVDDIGSLIREILPSNVVDNLGIVFVTTAFQNGMEGIHLKSYGIIDNILDYGQNLWSGDCGGLDMKDALQTFIQSKINIMRKWRSCQADKDTRFLSKAIIAMIYSEGLVLAPQFSMFGFIKKDGYLPQTCTVNAEVLYDEYMHLTFWITFYLTMCEQNHIPRLSNEEVYEITEDFIHIADLGSQWQYGNMDEQESMFFMELNDKNSMLYSRFMANYILKSLAYNPLYREVTNNPFPWMDLSLLNTVTSFFDADVVEYSLKTDYPIEYESDPEYESDSE